MNLILTAIILYCKFAAYELGFDYKDRVAKMLMNKTIWAKRLWEGKRCGLALFRDTWMLFTSH